MINIGIYIRILKITLRYWLIAEIIEMVQTAPIDQPAPLSSTSISY